MIRISNVDYINTLPYTKTFENSEFIKNNAIVMGQNPAGCAKELKDGKADIGLVPVGALDMLPEFKIIDGYGICADSIVDSVLIFSDLPLNELSNVYLDYQSKSSNGFLKILEKYYWKKDLNFIESEAGYEKKIFGKTGGLVIGDRALQLKSKFEFCTDVATEWYNFTGLPPVFAVWVANNNVDNDFIIKFLEVLNLAVENKKKIAEKFANNYSYFDLLNYLNDKIQYKIGHKEMESFKLYRKLLKTL